MSPVRWLRAVAVIGATALLMASSCSWQTGHADTRRRAAAAGRSGTQDRHPRQGQARRSAARMGGRTRARTGHAGHGARGLRLRRARRRGREPRLPSGVDDAGGHRAGGKPPRHLPRRGHRAERRRHAADPRRPPRRHQRQPGDHRQRRRRLDGEPEYARAMGPMQFIPETWKLYGVDANNDGIISPDNFDDAALSAAGYLCWRGKDLAKPSRLDGRAARLQPLRPVRPHGAGLGDGLRQRTPPLNTPRACTRSRLNSVQATSDQDPRRRKCPSSSRSEPARSSIPVATRRSRSKWPCWTARSPVPRCRRARRPASTRRWNCATAVPATAARASRRRWRPCSTRSRPRSSG